MGMTNFQLLLKVKFPIALGVIMGGIRIATVSIIGTITLAALISAGGLGELIFKGIATSNYVGLSQLQYWLLWLIIYWEFLKKF